MLKLTLLAGLLSCCFATRGDGPKCKVFPEGVVKVFTAAKTWDAARTACKSSASETYLKGDLVVVKSSQDIQDFIFQAHDNHVWIGGSDIDTEGTWKWVDGTSMPAQSQGFWASGEPNESGSQDCALTNWQTSTKWDDQACSTVLAYACQYKAKEGSKTKMIGDRVVEKFDVKQTYHEAKASCVAGGGHLITDNDDDVHTWLTHNAREYWIGATDYGTEGTWRWESGKDFSPDHWIEGGPDNALLAEHCATINRNTRTWEDNYCGERHYYACEYYLSCPSVEKKKVLKSKKKFSLKSKH